MKQNRNLIASCLCTTLLAGCGGGTAFSSQPSTPITPIHSPDNEKRSRTFDYTGAEQFFKVPANVTEIRITASGAEGQPGLSGLSGDGGLVRATIPVTPGEKLAVFVGGIGNFGSGGYNGGGAGGSVFTGYQGYSGGGASDVRQGGDALANRVVVAGGGGGQSGGRSAGESGGAGGGHVGASGSGGQGSGGGRGGTQHSGGHGGRHGHREGPCMPQSGAKGELGDGGSGGNAPSPCAREDHFYDEFSVNVVALARSLGPSGGGGGGGGYYGGGGGGAGGQAGGGGGGSSFVEKHAKHVSNRQGVVGASGQIVISW